MTGLSAVASLQVVNLGRGMAAALLGKQLSGLGATVRRPGTLDADPFTDVHPSYRHWRAAEVEVAPEETDAALASADVVVVGGEDLPGEGPLADAADVARAHPRAVVVDLRGYVAGSPLAGPAVDLLVQASTGMTWEHYSDRPICFGVPFPTYGQVLTAQLGLWAALVERQRSGRGQVVTATMQQGGAMFMAPFWMSATGSDEEFAKVAPKDANHLVFECADGTYVQMVLGVPQAIVKLYRALGIDLPADPADRGLPKPGAGAGKYFGDMDLYGPYVKKLTREEVIANCVREGIPVAPVLQPGEIWAHEQVAGSGLLREQDGHRTTRVPIAVADLVAGSPDAGPAEHDAAGPPLAGVTVFDAGSFLAGPYVSKLLADLGADVWKIEPVAGEPLRGIARTFQIICAGKRTLPLDAKSPFGSEVVGRIVERSDAVNYNYRPGVAARMGLDAGTLRARNPALVTLNTTGFGESGPMALEPAFDMVVQALTGLEVRGGGVGNTPQWYRLPYVDFVSAAIGAAAVLVGVFERRETGAVADLSTSLLEAALFMVSDLVQRPDGTFVSSPLLDHEQLGTHPAERIYRTADGWLAVAARSEQQARALVAVLGVDAGPRSTWGDDVREAIAREAARRTTDALLSELAARDVWAVECRQDGLGLARRDPAALAEGLLVRRSDAVYGETWSVTGPLVSFSRSRPRLDGLRGASPLGADTRDVLRDLGFSDEEIDAAYGSGAVR